MWFPCTLILLQQRNAVSSASFQWTVIDNGSQRALTKRDKWLQMSLTRPESQAANFDFARAAD